MPLSDCEKSLMMCIHFRAWRTETWRDLPKQYRTLHA